MVSRSSAKGVNLLLLVKKDSKAGDDLFLVFT